jgi:hypothetical protein
MALTEAYIRECSDEDLSTLLSAELNRWLPNGQDTDLDLFLARLELVPKGLRAMALIYELDVSITLDDLGWHFANWHHQRYCKQTAWALRELEAFEQADLFVQAFALAQPWWEKIGDLIGRDFRDFVEWYPDSDFEKSTLPLTRRMWELQKVNGGLQGFWTSYARKYPRNIGAA